ncbi:MAG: hypothetical protein IPN29_15425 [Saprospiraceae bacterium]|nr:hypothetical protein [Saprospiraceae bacterium]
MKERMFGLLCMAAILCGSSCKTSKNNDKAMADAFLFGMKKAPASVFVLFLIFTFMPMAGQSWMPKDSIK